MNPQDISANPSLPMAQALAQAMAALDPAGSPPVLVVDSVLTAQAIKAALAKTSWPGRGQGEPLPWCGTLDEAFDAAVDRCALDAEIPRPRSIAARRVQLAQQLMDYRSIAESLGGSSRAALHLAAKWVALFDGWEWLEMQSRSSATTADLEDASHLASDLSLLRNLQRANRTALDRAEWMAEYGASTASAVWFCINRSPSPKELAVASLIWSVPVDAIRVWSHAPVGSVDELRMLRADLARGSFANTSRNTSSNTSTDTASSFSSSTLANTPPVRQLIAAQTTEESAWAAAQIITAWRAQGIDDIGVVPLDRKMLRRFRALLERAGEPFADRSGWALDTTVAASAVVGLNDLLSHQATTQSVLEWIHSPFVMRGLAMRFDFVETHRRRLDTALRAYGRVAPVALSDLVDQDLLPLHALLPQVPPIGMRQTLAQWSGQLMTAMEAMGLESALVEDAAGQAVLAALQMLTAEALTDQSSITTSLWHAVLNESLAQSRFVEPVTQASVGVCSLASLSWRSPKAVLVLGADAQRLPEQTIAEFFEPKRFAEMGLINPPEVTLAEGFGQFASVWMSPLPMTLIACAEKPDSEVEFSSWVELLAMASPDLVNRQAAAAIIDRYVMTSTPMTADIVINDATPPSVPAPSALQGQLPEVISVTDLQRLIDCPYQFYLQTLLGLAPTKMLEEESPPSDLGSLIHQVLSDATMAHACAEDWADWLTRRIEQLLEKPFFVRRGAELAALAVPPAIAAKLRADAMALVPRLSEWLFERTSDPARASVQTLTETTVDRRIDALGVTIKGRIDRWEKGDETSVLIDFKTSDVDQLKKSVKPGDRDVQLPLYAWLIGSEHRVSDASYVSIRRDAVNEVGLTKTTGQPIEQLTQSVIEQVTTALGSIASGEPLALLGMTRDEKVCARCNVRGICRRDDLVVNKMDDVRGQEASTS